MDNKVDLYLANGCGRCPLGGTPDCKVHRWTGEMERLRTLVLECGLTEEVKWGVPCYTFENKNVLIVSAFKDYCALSFFKGVLLKDETGILVSPGENSQSARLVRFTGIREIMDREQQLRTLIGEALEVEKAGLKVNFPAKENIEYPDELQSKFDDDPVFRSAFEALTPGRRRGYILFFSQPKQSATRESRIEKNMARILEGRGLHDR